MRMRKLIPNKNSVGTLRNGNDNGRTATAKRERRNGNGMETGHWLLVDHM